MLDDVALKKYLNETPYPAQWATAKTLEDVAALEPAGLFQLDGAGSGDADVSSRYAEVVEELGRHATSPSSKFREPAGLVVAGLRQLAAASPAVDLSDAETWAQLEQLHNAALGQQVSEFSGKLAHMFGSLRFATSEHVNAMREAAGLPVSAMGQIIHELGGQGVRVIDPLPAPLQSEIESVFPFGIMQAVWPENYADGAPTSEYSLTPPYFIQAKRQVTALDLDAAIDFFTRSAGTQREKTAASKLRTHATDDAKLHNAIIAFHLDIWNTIRTRFALPQDVAARFASFGLAADDIALFTGETRPAPEPEAVPEPDPREDAEAYDRMYFTVLQGLMEKGRLTEAVDKLEELKRSGHGTPKSGIGADILTDLQARVNLVSQAVDNTRAALREGDVERAKAKIVTVRKFAHDDPRLAPLEDEIARMGRVPERIEPLIDKQMPPLGDIGLKRPLGFLPPSMQSTLGLALVLIIPSVLLDQYMAIHWPWPIYPEYRLIPGLIVGVGLAWLIGALRKRSWFLGMLALTGGLFSTLADGYFFTAIDLIVIYFAAATMGFNRQRLALARKWEGVRNAALAILQSDGLEAPHAGLYVGGRRMVPLSPGTDGVTSGYAAVDTDGTVRLHMSAEDRAEMIKLGMVKQG